MFLPPSLYSSLLPSASPTLLPFQIANETKVVVQKEENEATIRQRRHKQLLHDDAQRDLDKALPMLDAAIAPLKSLNKNDVVQVSWCHATVHDHGLKFILLSLGKCLGIDVVVYLGLSQV